MKLSLSLLRALAVAVLAAASLAAAASPSLRNVEGGYASPLVGAISPFGVRAELAHNDKGRLRIESVELTGVTGGFRGLDTAGCALTINDVPVPAAVSLNKAADALTFTPSNEVWVEGNKPLDVGCLDLGVSGSAGRRRSFLQIKHDGGKKIDAPFTYTVDKTGALGGKVPDNNGLSFEPATRTLRGKASKLGVDVTSGKLQWHVNRAIDLTNAQCVATAGARAPVAAAVDAKAGTVTVSGLAVNADQPLELVCTNVNYRTSEKDKHGKERKIDKKSARGGLRWLGGKDGKQTLAEQKAKVCENKFCSAAAPALTTGGAAALVTAAVAVVFALAL